MGVDEEGRGPGQVALLVGAGVVALVREPFKKAFLEKAKMVSTGRFQDPEGIARDRANGDIHATDEDQRRGLVFTKDGKFLRKIESSAAARRSSGVFGVRCLPVNCPRCKRDVDRLQSPDCPHPARFGVRVLRATLFLLAGGLLVGMLLLPLRLPLSPLAAILAFPLLAAALLLGFAPGLWDGVQTLGRKVIVTLLMLAVACIGAFSLIFVTCLAKLAVSEY